MYDGFGDVRFSFAFLLLWKLWNLDTYLAYVMFIWHLPYVACDMMIFQGRSRIYCIEYLPWIAKDCCMNLFNFQHIESLVLIILTKTQPTNEKVEGNGIKDP